MGTAGIPRKKRGNGYRYRGNTAEMELKLAGFPQVWDLLSREIRGVHLENLGASDIRCLDRPLLAGILVK